MVAFEAEQGGLLLTPVAWSGALLLRWAYSFGRIRQAGLGLPL